MKKQIVVRTGSHWMDTVETKELREALDNGYRVVMCNEVGSKLEYILEDQSEQK